MKERSAVKSDFHGQRIEVGLSQFMKESSVVVGEEREISCLKSGVNFHEQKC